MEQTVTVLNPMARTKAGEDLPARRPTSLDGLRLGLWWNRKDGGDFVLDRVGTLLAERFGVTRHEEAHAFPTAPGAVEQMAAEADVVVGAMADCGSCTAYLIHDMVALERLGIPSVALVAEHFIEDARATAVAFGMRDLPIVVVRRTANNLAPASAHELVDATLDEVVAQLTSQTLSPIGPSAIEPLPSEATLTYRAPDALGLFDALQEDFSERGWSDGFPVTPATPEAVERMLSSSGYAPDDEIVVLEPGQGVATAQILAVNAVMAGCRPEHFPVIVAAVRAMVRREFRFRGVAQSTGPHAPLLIVNGPIAKELGMNSGGGALGPGRLSRVNTVLGRAIRLIMMNVGKAYLGVMDMDTIGAPRKYSFCLAENETASPWDPFHVERGFDPSDSTASLCAVESEIEINDLNSKTPYELIKVIAGSALIPGASSVQALTRFGEYSLGVQNLLLLCPDHAAVFAKEGWSKDDIREALFQAARREWHWLAAASPKRADQIRPPWRWILDDPDTLVPVVRDPSGFQIVVVGASSGKSQYLVGTRTMVTELIR